LYYGCATGQVKKSEIPKRAGTTDKYISTGIKCGSFQPDQEKACNICPFQRFQYFPKAYIKSSIVFCTKDKLKFGAKLI
jgi:hypothetical protein